MVNIENINNKLSEIISKEIASNKHYHIKRFDINSIENVTLSTERLKLFNYNSPSGKPLEAFKLNVSFTVTRFSDDKEISLENIDFIWLADTVNDKAGYCTVYEDNLSVWRWDQEAPEEPSKDGIVNIKKYTHEYITKLNDLYTENYFTHERYTTEGTKYFFLYCFNKLIINSSFISGNIDSRNFSNSMLPADAQVICNLINQ